MGFVSWEGRVRTFQILSGIIVFFIVFFIAKSKGVLIQRLFFVIVSLIGMFFIAFPNLTTLIADRLGIGRGADLIFYLFIIFAWFWFVLMDRKLRFTERKLTLLIRHIALEHPFDGSK